MIACLSKLVIAPSLGSILLAQPASRQKRRPTTTGIGSLRDYTGGAIGANGPEHFREKCEAHFS
jgi:hypothetical protein